MVRIHILLLLCLTLTGCFTPNLNFYVGNTVTLSKCKKTWSVLTSEELSQPLKNFYECDILTSETLRDIKNNNDKLKDK